MTNIRLLLPDALGLRWGMSQSECRSQARGTVGTIEHTSKAMTLKCPGVEECLYVHFDDAGRLVVISATIHESRDFWEGDWDYEEMEAARDEARLQFEQAEREMTSSIGSPDFRGNSHSEDVGPLILGYADDVAIWQRDGCRIQLQFGQEDKEVPISVDLYVIAPHYRG